jgi:hypothetical protein
MGAGRWGQGAYYVVGDSWGGMQLEGLDGARQPGSVTKDAGCVLVGPLCCADAPTSSVPLSVYCCDVQARRFGVRSAMPGFIAKKLCPQVSFVMTGHTLLCASALTLGCQHRAVICHKIVTTPHCYIQCCTPAPSLCSSCCL